MRVLVLLVAYLCLCSCSRPDYDHQTLTYNSQFKPLRLENARLSLSPFFSPDYSLEQLVDAILEAKESIDISIPSISSWRSCTYPDPGKTCIGCTASELINSEKFPIFQALNNALHNGIRVNILTNDYNDELCPGKMDLLAYFQLAGATVRYYATTTFTHSKYMVIDNKTVLISSINWTKTSIMSNREAGIIFRNTSSINPVADFSQGVFRFDFEHGYEKKLPQFSEDDLALIRNAKYIPVDRPDPYHFNYCNVTSPKPVEIVGNMNVEVIVSPDFAFERVMNDLHTPQKSLQISIYQITDNNFCNFLMDLKAARPHVELKIFVSNEIYGADDARLATSCYNRLFAKGIIVRKSHPKCLRYSHQKFWIIDEEIVYMSTGNFSPSDYPEAPDVFPPYGEKGWRKVNRDYTIKIENSRETIARFQSVFDLDYNQGTDFIPTK